jgi:hypothetical protein
VGKKCGFIPQFLLSSVASIHGRPHLAFKNPALLHFRFFPKPDFIAF